MRLCGMRSKRFLSERKACFAYGRNRRGRVSFKTISKADVLGKWAVFFFYPADFTFVCPTELEDLADLRQSAIAFLPCIC